MMNRVFKIFVVPAFLLLAVLPAIAYEATEQYYLSNYLRNDAGLVSGHNIQEWGFNGNGEHDTRFYKVEYEYNTLGKVSKAHYFLSSWDTVHHTVEYGYDGSGNVISVSDGTNTTSYAYDAMNRLRRETDPRGVIIEYEYDSLGGVSEVRRVISPGNSFVYASYTYDGFGYRRTEVSPVTGNTSYTYDELGNLDRVTYDDGSFQDFDYDSEGRLKTIDYSDSGVDTIYTYDPVSGLLTTVTGASNGDAFTKTLFYDGFGRVLSQSTVVGSRTSTIQYAYNPGDNTIASVTYPSGRKAEYFYEHPILRLATRVDVVHGGTRQTLVSDVDYGNDGIVQGYTLRSGAIYSQEFVYTGHPSRQTIGGALDVSYTFDSLGRLDGIWDAYASSRTRQFEYNSVHALTDVKDSNSSLLSQFEYNDNLDRASESGSATVTPVYDPVTQQLDNYGTRDFEYDDRGNMDVWDSPSGTEHIIGYDARGLSASYQASGATTYLDRDETGALIMARRGAIYDHYVFNGSRLFYERDGQTYKETDYIYLNGSLIGTFDGALSNVVTGHLDQPQAMYSEAGAQVWRGIVDGFDIDVTVSQRDLKARFPGQYDILDNGTYYNHFRTYDPSMGRYLESDPIGLGGGSNHYGYVAGSPTMFVDELGLERKPGRTSPTKWPPLPANLGGKKPKWDSEGYWKGKGGGKFTWDDRSHGAGVDRGEGEQGGHWDDEESDNRYDEDGNPLPGSPDPIPGPSEEMAACPPDGIVTTENVAVAGGVALTGYLIYRGIRMAPSLWPPFWGTIPLNLATP